MHPFITTLTIVHTDLSQVPDYRTLDLVPGDSARSGNSWHRVIKKFNLNKRNLLEENTIVLLAKISVFNGIQILIQFSPQLAIAP